LPREAVISLRAFDVSGRQVRELASGSYSAGAHTLNWNLLDDSGHPVAGGIYFVRLAVEGRVLMRTVSITR
jgi:methionine-rich copper-binding protein CopC